MVLFPESVEDIDLIYAEVLWVEDCLESFIEQLCTQGNSLSDFGCEFQCYSDLLSASSQAAMEYCEDLALFSQELYSRVKYDVHMAVLGEEFTWYSVGAAVLAAELSAHSAELACISAALAQFSDDLRTYSDLLREYSEDR